MTRGRKPSTTIQDAAKAQAEASSAAEQRQIARDAKKAGRDLLKSDDEPADTAAEQSKTDDQQEQTSPEDQIQQAEAEEEQSSDDVEPSQQTENTSEEQTESTSDEQAQPEPQDTESPEITDEVPENGSESASSDENQPSGPVSDAIREITQSPPTLPGNASGSLSALLQMSVANVMRTDLAWATIADTVEQLTAKMQEYDIGYILVGDNGKLVGIVSKSDVRGAMSPYLQSMFAKWRGPMDIATLQLKTKWVMSRPVRTVRPDASLDAVIRAMTEYAVRCVPVVDEQGKVHGIVTVFDILTLFLAFNSEVTSTGRAPQSPPVV